MEEQRISKGGQLSIPAAVRRRWGTTAVVVEDLGDRLVVRPIPDDPVAAARGALPSRRHAAERDRARSRREEQAAGRRR